MKKLSRCYKRLKWTMIETALLAAFVSIFFMPSYIKIEETGNNMFTIHLNGEEIGRTGSAEQAEDFLRSARRSMAGEGAELVLADCKLEVTGEAVIWGTLDEEEMMIRKMEEVLRSHIKETLHRSYTVKINEYTVNLAGKDEVHSFLQAAVEKYDSEGMFEVSLEADCERELNVLTARVVSKEEKEQEKQSEAVMCAGIFETLEEFFADIEPAGEKEFEDFDLGLVSLTFDDKVEIVESYLGQEELMPLDAAIEEVTKEQEANQVYEVQPGDSLSLIALEHDLPMEKIIAMNENIESENSVIRVGEEIIITIPEPELSMVRQEDRYYEENYEADVIYVDNNNWYTTDMVTRQEPSAGQRKVVARVDFRNDRETGREILKEEITYEAVPKIVERGTKIPPTYVKPISGGRLSSGFGRRNRPTKGASSYHKGVDWATPVGTAVMASSAGTVARAGWGSGYGYVIYLDHGDGRQTRYGHLSKILVSPGQKVSQGQKIALSGNTGVSSGPHIHFEILINGSQVNPLKYLE